MTEPRRPNYVGKYRGKVLENVDPLFQGRIMAEVPAIPGAMLNWALPCTPYAGPNVGFYAIPPIGANVWIEFEGGDPNYPIWVGCFWGQEDILHLPEPPPPEVKVFKTEFVTMILSDLPEVGGFTLECVSPAVDVPLTMRFDSTGITMVSGSSTFRLTPDNITLALPPAAIEMTAETVAATLTSSKAVMTAEEILIESPQIVVMGDTSIDGAPAVVDREREIVRDPRQGDGPET